MASQKIGPVGIEPADNSPGNLVEMNDIRVDQPNFVIFEEKLDLLSHFLWEPPIVLVKEGHELSLRRVDTCVSGSCHPGVGLRDQMDRRAIR